MQVARIENARKKKAGPKVRTMKRPDRIVELKKAVQGTQPGVCAERALIVTRYYKDRRNRKKPACIQTAEALCSVLDEKSIAIYEDELLAGNFSSYRVGGSIFPELHGLVVLADLLDFPKRQTSPLQINPSDQAKLASIVPFWSTRFLSAKAFSNKLSFARFVAGQLTGRSYFINETGGISHLAPDYEKLCRIGCEGIIGEAREKMAQADESDPARDFYRSVILILEGLGRFGQRYAVLARQMADREGDLERKKELYEISERCSRVPQSGARTLTEALQAILLAQIALNLESLDNSMCPGRMDYYLNPFYERDLKAGILTRESAKELIACFCIKLCEIVPVFSRFITRVHGGMFNGQVVCVGGTDGEGRDSTNELTYIFLELMDELRMRQPNFLARVHDQAPAPYLEKVFEILATGANSPALYNDAVIVKNLAENGYRLADARNYTPVGCVEPVCQAKSFSSTDAALVNVPLCLELALNEGKPFGSRMRIGKKTPPVSRMSEMGDVLAAFEVQLLHQLDKCLSDLAAIEIANARFHPTPLTSSLLTGCLEQGRCSTQGGAVYNFSGVQCVGASDTGDSLQAIERAVFQDRRITLSDLCAHLAENLADDSVRRYLKGLPKFGNDDPEADRCTAYVADAFYRALSGRMNTRGGKYTMGIYSVTVHDHFGNVTGATPNGRRKGEPFSAGLSAGNGNDRKGPTALLNSLNRMDFKKAKNGVNVNIKFDAGTLRGKTGPRALAALLSTYFARGGMQAQVNVLDPETLKLARKNPELYPNLLVRVSGYSAYFADLTPKLQDEVIARTNLGIG
ncbi:MAG: pyruvate formate lyase family protein [Thermodesulfobacteriota bacterium]